MAEEVGFLPSEVLSFEDPRTLKVDSEDDMLVVVFVGDYENEYLVGCPFFWLR